MRVAVMRTYQTIVLNPARSTLREPVRFFFTLIVAPMLVVILGLIVGNDPSPENDGQGVVDATLLAFAVLVMAIKGVLTSPVSQL